MNSYLLLNQKGETIEEYRSQIISNFAENLCTTLEHIGYELVDETNINELEMSFTMEGRFYKVRPHQNKKGVYFMITTGNDRRHLPLESIRDYIKSR